MADALCGPSNPLQSFQKHTQADHTLLQDRISGPKHSPAQGFRTRDPRTGSLDAEFAAFEAGPANPFQLEQPLLHGNLPAYQPQVSRQNGAAPGWAADFQNLHISNQPIPSYQFRAEAPLVRSNGWQNDFAVYQSNSRSASSQGQQAVQAPNQNQYIGPSWRNEQYNFNDGHMGMAPLPYSYSQQQTMQDQQHSQQQAEPVYDEVGFAEAFEHASQQAQEMVKDQSEVDRNMGTDGSDLLHKDAIPIERSAEVDHGFSAPVRSPSPTQIRIGSDAIPYQDHKTRTPDQDSRDADELARTAGQLLNSVQHDTSDKFQNSQFLALMRKIRDGEVRVEGEEFRETHGSDKMSGLENASQLPSQGQTDAHQLHPGGPLYPEQSPLLSRATMSGGLGITADDLHHFDHLEESPGLSNRYQRPSVEDYGDRVEVTQRGVENWAERAVTEAKGRPGEVGQGRKAIIEAKDCFLWKSMEEDGVA